MVRLITQKIGFGWTLRRLVKDERGMESVEVALSIALIAAVAGFGMVFLGDALAAWFNTAGSSFSPTAQFPSQTLSTTIP
jgi:Flp pilus assembly pilin Flp